LKPDEFGSPDIENLLFAGFKMYHPCLPCDALTRMRGAAGPGGCTPASSCWTSRPDFVKVGAS